MPSVTGAILVSSNQACFADCPATTVDSVYYGDPEDICERPPPPCSNNFPSGCTCTGSTLTSCTAHDASSGGTTLDLSWNGINGGLGRRIRWAVACDHHQPEHNSITAVSAGVFTGLSSLTVLKLAHNSITAISATIFTGLSTVTSLQLSDNSISAMPTGTFSSFPSLIYLDLGGGNDLSVSQLVAGLTCVTSIFCICICICICFDYGAIPFLPAIGGWYVPSPLACSADCPATFIAGAYYGYSADICEKPQSGNLLADTSPAARTWSGDMRIYVASLTFGATGVENEITDAAAACLFDSGMWRNNRRATNQPELRCSNVTIPAGQGTGLIFGWPSHGARPPIPASGSQPPAARARLPIMTRVGAAP